LRNSANFESMTEPPGRYPDENYPYRKFKNQPVLLTLTDQRGATSCDRQFDMAHLYTSIARSRDPELWPFSLKTLRSVTFAMKNLCTKFYELLTTDSFLGER